MVLVLLSALALLTAPAAGQADGEPPSCCFELPCCGIASKEGGRSAPFLDRPPESVETHLPCGVGAGTCAEGWFGAQCAICKSDAACVNDTGDAAATCSSSINFAPNSQVPPPPARPELCSACGAAPCCCCCFAGEASTAGRLGHSHCQEAQPAAW